jgi:hypothetical protein
MNRKPKQAAIEPWVGLNEEFDLLAKGTTACVTLLKPHGIARSQARRLFAVLVKFEEVTIDFRKVRSLGQGFADEVFRVFINRNPRIVLHAQNASPPVMAMIRHVRREAPADGQPQY